jgi:hypothetical protein
MPLSELLQGNKTMKLEKSTPTLIQYRCGLCNRIERMRLFRRSRDSTAGSEGE